MISPNEFQSPEQTSINTLEKKKLCCNPLSICNTKTSDSLRKCSEPMLVEFLEVGINWVTNKMYCCRNCLKLIRKLKQEKPPVVSPVLSSSSSQTPSSSPSSDESGAQQQKLDTILDIAKLLKISIPSKPAKLNPNTRSYVATRSKEMLEMILLKVQSLFPPEVVEKTNPLNEIYSNMVESFDNTEDKATKSAILRCLPQSFSNDRAVYQFNATKRLVEEARGNADTSTKIPRGRPSTTESTTKSVVDFYLRDEISRPFPGRKDWKSIKQPNGKREKIQKRLLMATLDELFEKYQNEEKTDEHGETILKVERTKFKMLRPKQCVFPNDPAAFNVCVCMIHANTEFQVEALKVSESFKSKSKEEMIKTFTDSIVCTNPTDACHLRECNECINFKVSESLSEALDNDNVLVVNYKQWITSPRAEITEQEDELDEFLDRFDTQFEKYVTHQFKVRKQLKFIKDCKNNLIPGKQVMLHMDFAEKYVCHGQDAIQSAYFDSKSVSIHPFVLFYKDKKEPNEVKSKNYVVISEGKEQNTNAVYTFLKKLVPEVKKMFPELEKIFYLSDGCAEQYKNKKNFINLCRHKIDFGLDAEWHFFPTSHGKGPCDGIGGVIKRMAHFASARQVIIKDAQTFYIWAETERERLNRKAKEDKWNFIFVTELECQDTKEELKERFDNLVSIPGTHAFHAFVPKDETHVYVSDFSGQHEVPDESYCFCLVKTLKREKREKRRRSEDNEETIRRSTRQKKTSDVINYNEDSE